MDLITISELFLPSGSVSEVFPLGEGFINDTYIVSCAEGSRRYVLQRKNHNIFRNVPAMMENIVKVSRHIASKVESIGLDPLTHSLTVVPAHDGRYYAEVDGNFWTMSLFIADSVCYEVAGTEKLAYMGGRGVGLFQAMLSDFHDDLYPTIPGFHDIAYRFSQWDESLKKDAAGRVAGLSREIDWIECRRAEMLDFWSMYEKGDIVHRVSHNDTKIANILFDENDDVLCMIDLDTVMVSTSLNDFGDSIRSYANTGREDDSILSNVSLSLPMFSSFADGYLEEQASNLSDTELQCLAFSARYITFEQTLRFLMDYIDGDTYYKISFPEHNIQRANAQYALLLDMERKYDRMRSIIEVFMNKHTVG